VRIEPKLICGVKECRYQNNREVAVNTQRDKISHAKWEKADAWIQAGGEYAYRRTKVGMLSGRSQMPEYRWAVCIQRDRKKKS